MRHVMIDCRDHRDDAVVSVVGGCFYAKMEEEWEHRVVDNEGVF